MKNKKLVIVILIILIIGIICAILFLGNNKQNEKNQVKQTTANIQNTQKQENKISNNTAVVNDTTNQISNETENETVNEIQEEQKNEKENTEIIEGGVKTSEEKALEIVKKDWGNSTNVDINIDGMNSDGNYIVSVRDLQTTQALAFYTVNTSNGTFNKREMN